MGSLAEEIGKVQIILGKCRTSQQPTNLEGFGREEQDAIEGFLSAVKNYVNAGYKGREWESVFILA